MPNPALSPAILPGRIPPTIPHWFAGFEQLLRTTLAARRYRYPKPRIRSLPKSPYPITGPRSGKSGFEDGHIQQRFRRRIRDSGTARPAVARPHWMRIAREPAARPGRTDHPAAILPRSWGKTQTPDPIDSPDRRRTAADRKRRFAGTGRATV